jgi:hypothetical protein
VPTKKKTASCPTPGDRAALRESITDQVTTLIERAGHLRDTGKVDEARRLLMRIEALTEELKGLEK